MRILLLIALLCNVAFSALYLSGAEYTQVVTINHLQVEETTSGFLYQLKIPRVGALLTAVESADDVAFTNVNDTTRRARWVVYTPDTIFLYAHIAVSSTVDTSYRLQYGKSLNEVNSSSTFTNCGITNYWGLNESGGSTTSDIAGGANGTVMSPAETGVDGFFSKSVLFKRSSSTTEDRINTDKTSLPTPFSFSCIFNATTAGSYPTYGYARLFSTYSAATGGYTIYIKSDGKIGAYIGNGVSNVGRETAAGVYNFNTWNHILVTCNSDSIITVVLNKNTVLNAKMLTSVTGSFLVIGNATGDVPYTFDGKIDEVAFTSGVISTGNNNSNYNMLFNPSTFSTLGTPIATEFSAEMGIDTLTFTCSAENAMTYQWYLDGAEIVGETDSVLVIYADSTFYSTAHTLYCLVNSSVISDSWVIATEFSAEMGIDTLRLVCSAENALTYQWYDNNVAVSGATDSVYTIYADSAFYSIKHVIYCLVNGTVKSDEWVIMPTSAIRTFWGNFLRNFGFGRGR